MDGPNNSGKDETIDGKFDGTVSKTYLLKLFNEFDVYTLKDTEMATSELNVVSIDLNSSLSVLISTALAISCEIKKQKIEANYIVGIPYDSIFLSTFVGEKAKIPFLLRRKEAKSHGTKKLIEGTYRKGEKVLIVQNVLDTGSNLLETVNLVRQLGLVCEDAFCVLNQLQNGCENLKKSGICLHSLLTAHDVSDYISRIGCKGSEKKGRRKINYSNREHYFDINNVGQPIYGVGGGSLIAKFAALEVFKFGEFQLKSGCISPVYVDFRGLISSLDTLLLTATAMSYEIKKRNLKVDYISGVPYGAMILSALVAERINVSLLGFPKETDADGVRKPFGEFKKGQKVLIIEDVVTTGTSILETAAFLRHLGLVCEEAICLLDRNQGGYDGLKKNGIQLYWLYTLNDAIDYMVEAKQMSVEEKETILLKLAQS